MIKLGILGSTQGTALQAILDSIQNGELSADIMVVISDRENGYILERAKKHSLPTCFINHKGKTRERFELEITESLKHHGAEFVLLIGFMRILEKKFCLEWKNRILNVHPSLLPKYSGKINTAIYQEVLNNGDNETGCTIHFVTDKVDSGPILIQKKCIVNIEDTIESLKIRVQQLEMISLIEAIQLVDAYSDNFSNLMKLNKLRGNSR